MNAETRCLAVRGLKTFFFGTEGVVKAVDGISFHIDRGEIVGLVGESGCGKSAAALSILRLIPWPPGRIVDGQILFHGQDLRRMPEADLRSIRGNRISMIFQEPMTSLTPVYTVGRQIAEVYRTHRGQGKKAALENAVRMLEKVQIPSASRRIHEYPHQLSGGMRQRVMIAMALACNPELIIADEPTTALDVTIQAQIIELMVALQQETGTAVLLITHNLGLVAQYAARVIVMYSGKIVEQAPVSSLFENPRHPYTRGLLSSIPRLGRKATAGKQRLTEIPGLVPEMSDLPVGCNFHPRCPSAGEVCRTAEPELIEIAPGHTVSCWFMGGNRD